MMRARLTTGLCITVCAGACADDAAPVVEVGPRDYVAIARGRVDVEGGVIEVTSPRDGMVAELCVGEADVVEAGAVLLRFGTRREEHAALVVEAELRLAKAQLDVVVARLDAATARERLLADAAADGAVAPSQLEDARAELGRLTAEKSAAEASVALAEVHLGASELNRETAVVRAPVAGRIVRCRAHAGLSAAHGAPLFELLPDSPRIVRAWLSEQFVGGVRVDMKARVEPDYDGAKAARAHVVRIGDIARPADLGNDAQERLVGNYVECVLNFDGDAAALRVGQRVLVTIR